MTVSNFPINKKTLVIGAIALSLTMGGLVVSGVLSRAQKTAKTPPDFGQTTDVIDINLSKAHVGHVQTDEIERAAHDAMKKERVKQTQLVHYVALDDANLSPFQKQSMARLIKNLEKTGSTSGGVLTTEFKSATHAKMSYRFGRKQPLAFHMADIKDALPSGFVLTGREYRGVINNGGFDGVYRLFENPSTKALFEINETYIHPDKPLVVIKELYRENIDGTPLRFEQLTDKKGRLYYHGQFVAGNRYVSMTSRDMNLPEFMSMARTILVQVKNEPQMIKDGQ